MTTTLARAKVVAGCYLINIADDTDAETAVDGPVIVGDDIVDDLVQMLHGVIFR